MHGGHVQGILDEGIGIFEGMSNVPRHGQVHGVAGVVPGDC